MIEQKKCAVALSGGVDSAVAAYLLQQEGWDVTGVFAINWPESRCCSTAQQGDVDRVAKALGIPLFKIDVMVSFVRNVVDPFCETYLAGETPSPCTQCNRTVRFGTLWEAIKDRGFAFMASGHYARITYDPNVAAYRLQRGVDAEKDQSYMLYGLSQEQLARTRTPLGGLTKQAVRALARKVSLPVATKADSQDICFVQEDHGAFIEQYTGKPLPNGDFVDQSGKVLGPHQGIGRYTVGQRRGLRISAPEKRYVTGIDAATGAVHVGRAADLTQSKLQARAVHWTWPEAPCLLDHHQLQIGAQIRYNAPSATCTLTTLPNDAVEVHFYKPQTAITPGQAVVFYLEEMVVGGGIISRGLS